LRNAICGHSGMQNAVNPGCKMPELLLCSNANRGKGVSGEMRNTGFRSSRAQGIQKRRMQNPETERAKCTQAHNHTSRRANRQTGKQADRQTGTQANTNMRPRAQAQV
jgi:hypothetical protein